MVKVFVAQTHDEERKAVCDFLQAAGFDPKPHKTTREAIMWLGRELYFANEPTVLVTSQRDLYGCDYIPNLLQPCLLASKEPSLTVIYSRAVAFTPAVRDMAGHIWKMFMMASDLHQVELVPKALDGNDPLEHAKILKHIHRFLSPPKPQNE